MKLTLERYLSWQVLKQPPNAATCSYKHTRSQTNVTQTRIYTLPGPRTHTLYGSVLIARDLPAVRDLWENRTPPVPLSSPHKPREALRPTGATSFYSLPMLNGSLSTIFSLTIYPCVCCSFPSLLLCVWSQGTRFWAFFFFFFNHIKGFLTRE